MLRNKCRQFIPFFVMAVLMHTMMVTQVWAAPIADNTPVSILDSKVTVTATLNSTNNGQGTCEITGTNSIKITSVGDKGIDDREDQVVTLTNATQSKATLYFSYSKTNSGEYVKINGTTVNPPSTFSQDLDPGASVIITTKGKTNGLFGLSVPASLIVTISDISLTPVATTTDVTVYFDGTLGAVTVDGTAVSNGYQKTGITEGTSLALVATPSTGTTFLGWCDADGKVLSTAASFSYVPKQSSAVRAVFVNASSKAHFGVGGAASQTEKYGFLNGESFTYHTVSYNYIFDDLNEAATHTAGSGNKYIVLLNDATLPAGTYTIPAEVTLLIPFDSGNTLYTTASQWVSLTNHVVPTAYRTLKLADGANLVINGAMSVSGKHSVTTTADGYKSPGYGNSPTGAVGFVEMENGSNITVNNGGKIYVYGYITGSGSITANSGSAVYEMLQVGDFRGGSATTDSGMKTNKVFPFSQYYVQNIEVPLTVHKGAIEYMAATMVVSGMTVHVNVQFIGTGSGMFNLVGDSNDYCVKDYIEETDRLAFSIYGNATVYGFTMNLPLGQKINTEDYVFPITNNMNLNLMEGTVDIQLDIALLPGAQALVGEGVTLTLSKGNSAFVYDADDWGAFCYDSQIGGFSKFIPLVYAPGRTCTRTEADLVDATLCVNGIIDCSTAGAIYSTAGGSGINSTDEGKVILNSTPSEGQNYQRGSDYVAVSATSIILENYDDSTVSTATVGPKTYNYLDGYWHTADVCDGTWGSGVTCGCGHDASTVWINGSTKTYYGTLAFAVSKYDGNGYLQMETDTTEATISAAEKDIVLNLNGRNVTVTSLTVNKLYGMDTATDALEITYDAANNNRPNYGILKGTITSTVIDQTTGQPINPLSATYPCAVGPNNGKLYVAYTDSNGTSFHRVRFGVNKFVYYPQSDGSIDTVDIVSTYVGDAKALEVLSRDNTKIGMLVTGMKGTEAIDNTGSEWAAQKESVSDKTTKLSGYEIKGRLSSVSGATITVKSLLEIDGEKLSSEHMLFGTVQPNGLRGASE